MHIGSGSYRRGVVFICLSAFSLALFGLFVKLSNSNIPFFFLTFLRFFVPLLLLVPVMFWRGSFEGFYLFRGSKNQFIRCFFVLLSQYSIFYYLTQGSLLNAALLQNTGPLFIPIMERLFFGDRIGKSTWISLIVSAVGVICLLQPGDSLFTTLSFIGLLAGVGQAGSQVFYSKNAKKEKNDVNLFYLFFLGSLFSLLPVLLLDVVITPDFSAIMGHFFFGDPRDIAYLVALSLAALANQGFRGMAYQQTSKSSVLAPFFYTGVLFSGLFDLIVFDDVPNLLSIFGAFLIILGGILKIVLRKKFLATSKKL